MFCCWICHKIRTGFAPIFFLIWDEELLKIWSFLLKIWDGFEFQKKYSGSSLEEMARRPGYFLRDWGRGAAAAAITAKPISGSGAVDGSRVSA